MFFLPTCSLYPHPSACIPDLVHKRYEQEIHVHILPPCQYPDTLQAMRSFSSRRTTQHADQIWVLEHFPCYTLHPKKAHTHIISTLPYPLHKTDRGGDITHHAPGQIMIYTLLNVRTAHFGIKQVVSMLEQLTIDLLADLGIAAYADPQARGVYIDGKKIASIGLKIAYGHCYHGLAINVDMDLQGFAFITPCGLKGMRMTQLSEYVALETLKNTFLPLLHKQIQNLLPSHRVQSPVFTT